MMTTISSKDTFLWNATHQCWVFFLQITGMLFNTSTRTTVDLLQPKSWGTLWGHSERTPQKKSSSQSLTQWIWMVRCKRARKDSPYHNTPIRISKRAPQTQWEWIVRTTVTMCSIWYNFANITSAMIGRCPCVYQSSYTWMTSRKWWLTGSKLLRRRLRYY